MNIEELMENARLKGRVIALEAELESEKAAYKALRASSFVTAVPSEEYEKLKAEVERLKAENAWIKGEEYVHTELGSLVPKYLLEHWIAKAKDLEKTKNEYLEIGLTIDEENDSLKAEVDRLKGIILAQSSDFVRSKTADDGIKPDGHNDLAGRAVERCLELQAEVERLRQFNDEAMAHIAKEERKSRERLDMAQAEVELLRKAGDAMAYIMAYENDSEFNGFVDAWNAAKEGKPSV